MQYSSKDSTVVKTHTYVYRHYCACNVSMCHACEEVRDTLALRPCPSTTVEEDEEEEEEEGLFKANAVRRRRRGGGGIRIHRIL